VLSPEKGPYDFSPESLTLVDEVIDAPFHNEDPVGPEDPDYFIFGAGAYYRHDNVTRNHACRTIDEPAVRVDHLLTTADPWPGNRPSLAPGPVRPAA
jgi:hypothetical protein